MLETHPSADRLAALRDRIGTLKEEEMRLSLRFIQERDTRVFKGRRCDVLVEQEESREFDPGRLPAEIRRDPHYWTTRFRTHIKVRNRFTPSDDMYIGHGEVIDLTKQGGVYC
ncbi:hypothetical protein OU789_05135 [Halocynthiibacter sp. C4]|uniref:hypothetical protein n=1 Tax=Halocynthiibacter sp. C4 TaxID=2992758 RepID=UPI00237A19C1|nr:hypothetical protein [Halocynthiibacter sp. C4]MDE0589305.1 hypothetical protein [Halocynthiibacter sp. C4]